MRAEHPTYADGFSLITDAFRDASAALSAIHPGLLDGTAVVVPATTAARDVLAERRRQIEVEGWTPEHDDEHNRAELACAAACYALSGTPVDESLYIHGRWKDVRDLFWPKTWGIGWWKPTNRRRDLVKAGALILAEIERLDRTAGKEDAR